MIRLRLRAFLRIVLLAPIVLMMALPAGAVQPDEILEDPALESRAREISKELRCLVCQNQSIDDSNAELARDLRVIVRERLTEGDSDEEVIDFVVARYGDYVLLRPPMKPETYGLWFGPAVILVIAALAVFFWLRGRAQAARAGGSAAEAAEGLSDEEQARLSRILEEEQEAQRGKKDSS